jgi:hypothetical protein
VQQLDFSFLLQQDRPLWLTCFSTTTTTASAHGDKTRLKATKDNNMRYLRSTVQNYGIITTPTIL